MYLTVSAKFCRISRVEKPKNKIERLGEKLKRTYQPNKSKRKKNHGFRARTRKSSGSVLKSRRAKGRKVLSA